MPAHALACEPDRNNVIGGTGTRPVPSIENIEKPRRYGARKSYDLLMRLTAQVRAIRAADGRHYAAVPLEGRVECYRLGSGEFRRLLLQLHHDATGCMPQEAVVTNIVAMLKARAEIKNDVEPVFLRVAPDEAENAYFLDLGDRSRRAVKITRAGWEIVEHPGVAFWRPPCQRALPVPERGGSIEVLRKYVNVTTSQWPLFVVWLTAAIRPVGPYPLLVLTGEQGSGKTTLAEVCRRLIDPHDSLPRGLPRSERDLMVAAHHAWLQIYDNTSAITNWQSDALCRLSTGGGFAARSLFSDDGETIINAERPIVLTGIDDFVRRGDLMDRSIFLQLDTIFPEQRLERLEFWADFRREHPQLLGSLLDAVAGGIEFRPQVRLRALSRMAGLDLWGEAVVRGLGWAPGTFVAAYQANRRASSEQVLEDSPLVTALVMALEAYRSLCCSATELLEILTQFKPAHATAATGWPKSPWALSRALRRLAVQLRALGIEFQTSFEHRGRVMTLVWSGATEPCAPELPPYPST